MFNDVKYRANILFFFSSSLCTFLCYEVFVHVLTYRSLRPRRDWSVTRYLIREVVGDIYKIFILPFFWFLYISHSRPVLGVMSIGHTQLDYALNTVGQDSNEI